MKIFLVVQQRIQSLTVQHQHRPVIVIDDLKISMKSMEIYWRIIMNYR